MAAIEDLLSEIMLEDAGGNKQKSVKDEVEEAAAPGRPQQHQDSPADNAASSDMYEASLWNEAFGDGQAEGQDAGSGATTPRVDPGSSTDVFQCSACRMTSQDVDLADPCGSSTTAFSRTRSSAPSAQHACDHCFGLMRLAGSRVLNANVVVDRSQPGGLEQYLNKLAVYCAMKASESSSRVHMATMERTAKMVDHYSRIQQELYMRNGIMKVATHRLAQPSSSCRPLAESRTAMILDAYVNKHGNPLANGDSIIQGEVVEGEATLIVLTDKNEVAGEHSLVWAADAPPAIAEEEPAFARLKAMSVDDENLVAIVRHCAAEHISKLQLRRLTSKKGLAQVKIEEPTRTTVANSPASAAAHFAPTALADPARMPVSSPPPAPPALVTPKKAPVRRSHCSASFDPTSITASPGSPSAASCASSAPAPSVVPGNLARSHFSLAEDDGDDEGGGDGNGTLNFFQDKATAKLANRVTKMMRLFTTPKWTGELKGKERALKKIMEYCDVRSKELCDNEAEHLIEDVALLVKVAMAILHIVRRAKSKLFSPIDFAPHLQIMSEYIDKYMSKEGARLCLDPMLNKLLVVCVCV